MHRDLTTTLKHYADANLGGAREALSTVSGIVLGEGG